MSEMRYANTKILIVTRYCHVSWDDAERFVHRTKLCNSGTCR